jgi:hypothetical protein
MLVKFTNAAEDLKGNLIYINTDWIISVYEMPTDGGSLRTVVYGGSQPVAWEVQESLSEAVKMINTAKGCSCK